MAIGTHLTRPQPYLQTASTVTGTSDRDSFDPDSFDPDSFDPDSFDPGSSDDPKYTDISSLIETSG
ncbi:MAG: hypothetical protein M0019_08740 [Actinomycetota bacterium]|nr:hypothetical protein [Actinomycetota bacterium]